MRPVKLELKGFAAFRDEVVVNFDDADYFALVGPTGAGKSSVLDAICLALYGSVPRYDKAEIGPVVSLGAPEARVALHFTVGDERYVVVRVLSRGKSDVKTKAITVERVLADDTTEVLAAKKREADEIVPGIVGLGYDHFCKCVLLPQGQFARFLHDGATERQALLRELLDLGVYRRIQQAAGTRASTANAEADTYTKELAKLPDSSPEALAAAVARVGALRSLDADVAVAHEESEARIAAGSAARATIEHETKVVAALEAVSMPAGALDALSDLAGAQERVTLCDQALTAAEVVSERVEVALAAAPDLAMLERAVHAHDELADARAALATVDAEAEPAREAARRATELLAGAAEAHERAVLAVRERELDHAPHALAAKLAVGEPCPVCEQTVRKLPKALRDQSALDDAKRSATELEALRNAGEAAAQRATREVDTIEATRVARAERVTQCEASVAAHPDRDALLSTLEQVRALVAQRDAARAEYKALQQRHREARTALDAVQRRAGEHADAFRNQRDALVAAQLPVPAATGDLGADWPALVVFAGEVRPDHEKARDAAAEERNRLLAEEKAALAALCERAAPLGVAPVSRIAELVRAVAVAHAKADSELENLRQTVQRRADFEQQIVRLRADAGVASEVHRLLRVDRFEAWLLEEAMDALLDGGSEMLQKLSSGAYSLARDERELMVVDHRNADEMRSVRTLSGGETFQASLALALALADHIASLDRLGAAKLESLFLDEGFGSLDPETLDVVASTVETLADGERMVGLVTHVRELAERVPVRFEVRKQGRTSVVERIDR